MRAGALSAARIGERRRLLGAAASAILVLVAAILAVTGSGAEVPVAGQPRLVDAAGLAEAEEARGQPIYWAGERPPRELELTVEANGSAYVRYVPPGDAAGGRREPLTVATYRVADAEAALRAAALAVDVEPLALDGGGLAFVPPSPSRSAYLVFPGSEQQVEVYDPAPGRAARLVTGGAIRPAGGSR